MLFGKARDVRRRPEIALELRALEEWEQLMADNPHFRDPDYIWSVAAAVVQDGAIEPLTGTEIPAGALQLTDNLREGLEYQYVNSRTRAVLLSLQWALAEKNWSDAKIYAAEAVTPFALRLRGIFAKFIGSEYSETEEQRQDLYPIPIEDLQKLTFPSDVFDVVTTNEVLEHVPSIDEALGEICRVLKPGGWHIGTAPFAVGQYDSIRKAELINGQVNFLTDPEYHGNPVDEKGSLVFEVPGWDILERARKAGFRDAFVRFLMSTKHACFSSDAGGIFVFCFQK
jgi:SAM-dependent methyltransferase